VMQNCQIWTKLEYKYFNLDIFGIKAMYQFSGQEKCLIDSNGRVKLSPRFLSVFEQINEDVVLHCLVEGALAIYPQSVWQKIQRKEQNSLTEIGQSILVRRRMRRIGALTKNDKISKQGRITIPTMFRSLLKLEPNTEAMLVGSQAGVEVWNYNNWQAEFNILVNHEEQLMQAEMNADITRFTSTQANN